MLTRYILAGLAAVFLVAALVRLTTAHGSSHPQVKTWLLLGGIFTIVSAWLFY